MDDQHKTHEIVGKQSRYHCNDVHFPFMRTERVDTQHTQESQECVSAGFEGVVNQKWCKQTCCYTQDSSLADAIVKDVDQKLDHHKNSEYIKYERERSSCDL